MSSLTLEWLDLLLGHHELIFHIHGFHLEHCFFLRLHSETFSHLLESLFLLSKLRIRFVSLLLQDLYVSAQLHVLLLKCLQLASHVLEYPAFDVELGFEIGDLALVISFHCLLFFFELLLDSANLELGVGCCLSWCVLVVGFEFFESGG